MTAYDDIIAIGIDQIHRGICPACAMTMDEANAPRLQPDQPGNFHYHGNVYVDPPYLWCPKDGQGYRLVGPPDDPDLRIIPPCNGGLHADGGAGYR